MLSTLIKNMLRTISEAISHFFQNVLKRIEEWSQRARQLDEDNTSRIEYQSEQEEAKYRPEKVDVILGLQCKEYLTEVFPDGIAAKVQNMSNENLLELFQMIEKEAERIMDVHVDDVDFYSTTEEPYCNYGGYYQPADNTFHINMTPVYSGNPYCIEYEIYAIFHELKHARQWAAVKGRECGGKDYGYSDRQLDEWQQNMLNYITMEENDELYMKQPLEMDSRGFESIVSGERKYEVI